MAGSLRGDGRQKVREDGCGPAPRRAGGSGRGRRIDLRSALAPGSAGALAPSVVQPSAARSRSHELAPPLPTQAESSTQPVAPPSVPTSAASEAAAAANAALPLSGAMWSSGSSAVVRSAPKIGRGSRTTILPRLLFLLEPPLRWRTQGKLF